MSVLPAVLKAAQMGLACFPLDSGDKRPLTHNGRRIEWSKVATTDETNLTQWFAAYPGANYGVAAKQSNLLIVDCDMGDNPDSRQKYPLPPRFDKPGINCGEDVLAEMTDQFGVEYPFGTLTVRTPKGGAHYYFANATGEAMSQAPLVKNWIDVRSNGGEKGGYVVGPGSTVGGRVYTVANSRAPILPAPRWLVDLCRYRDVPPAPARPWTPGTGKLQPLLDTFRNAAIRNQSYALYWAACAAAKDGVALMEAVDGFAANLPANEKGRPPWTRSDVESQVRSAYQRFGVGV